MQDKEIQQKLMAGWAVYVKHRDVFKSNVAICLKRHVYNVLVCATSYDVWLYTFKTIIIIERRREM